MPRVERFWEAFSTRFRILAPSESPREPQWPAYVLQLTLGAIYSAEGRLVPATVRIGGVEGDQVMAADPDTALLDRGDVVRIAGRTAFLGNHMAHFGHFVTEFLSTLWDFHRLDEYDQYAVFPFVFDRGRVRFAPYHTQALECLGIDPRRVLVLGDQPASFALIDVFERLWHNNDHVDAAVLGVYDRLLEEFGARRNDCERRIFLSRQTGVGLQRLANTGDVEAVFASHGFEILHPEKMDFAEQISRYANARVVAGFAGSAVHNCVFMRSGVLIEVGDLRSRHTFPKMQVLANSLRPITPCRIDYVGDERGVIDVAHVDRRLAGILAEARRHVRE
jgi:capsular polysaccharide biosynthesis protein